LNNMSNNFENILFPIIHNVDGNQHLSADDTVDALCKQVNSPVLWTKTIEHIKQMNITNFVEIGPGNVLSGLNKRIANDITTMSISNYENINDALEMN